MYVLVRRQSYKMHYILVIKLFSSGASSWKIKGLSNADLHLLRAKLDEDSIPHNTVEEFLEVDWGGVEMLNMLASNTYNYRVVGQSMAIEKSGIGGRTVQVEKIAWTMAKGN